MGVGVAIFLCIGAMAFWALTFLLSFIPMWMFWNASAMVKARLQEKFGKSEL